MAKLTPTYILGVDLSLSGTGCIILEKDKVVHEQLIKSKPTDNLIAETERLDYIAHTVPLWVGEGGKRIWKVNQETNWIDEIPLPGRSILKFENPTIDVLKFLRKEDIIKVILTQPGQNIEEIKKILKQFDAYILLEQYPHERRQVSWTEGEALDFGIENLLKLYAKERKVDESKLMAGWELIK